jgi:transposase
MQMLKDLRAQLLEYGVPKRLLKSFEGSIRTDIEGRCQKRVEAAEQRSMEWSNVASTWRIKYMREHERAQKLELSHTVKDEKINRLQKVIGKLSAFIKQLRKGIFSPKSERGASAAASPSQSTEASPNTGRKRGKQPGAPGHGRKPDSGLPVEPVEHDIEDPDKFCKCGGEFELEDLAPAASLETHFEEKAVVRKHLRRRVVRHCKRCGQFGKVKTAPKPPKLIPKGKYSTGFWRHILEEKYWLQRPLNRACVKLRSLSIIVRLGTLINGLEILYEAHVFEVMYEAILDRSRLAEQRNMDETGWKVFSEKEEGRSSNWYMWVSVTVDATVFILDPRRSNEVIAEHLQGVAEGIIICDRHSSYKCFGKKNEGFLIAFCWVHQRRDFIKIKEGYAQHGEWAQDWLSRIDALIAQNNVRVACLGDADQFKAEDAILRKMIQAMEKTIETQLTSPVLAEEQIARLKSLQVHWSGLTIFLDRPHVPMSNNEAERALRDAVLGRKSYYGSRSHWSGLMTGWLFTIYATLEQNDIDPHQWMGDYLESCARNNGCPPQNKDLQRFLPWNYKTDRSSNPSIPHTQSLADSDSTTIPFTNHQPLTISVLPSSLSKPPPLSLH